MKNYTEHELRLKAEAYCSAAEHCPSEIRTKLALWGADETTTENILSHLLKERYLDNERFCRFFVRDKYRFNQWGRLKIIQALRMKQLPQDAISNGLDEIDEREYADILQHLLKQKAKTVKAATEYERNAKLMRFAAGRGFSADEIMQQFKQTGANDDITF